MVERIKEFEHYIMSRGVGKNDKVADSVKSYSSYLRGVSKHLGITISPNNLSSESDVVILADRLTEMGKLSKKTINNFKSAMNQYVDMINCSN